MSERTEYDIATQQRFLSQYHSPPFPGQRTEFDQQLQNKWCSASDTSKTKENYGNNKMQIDVIFRTEYDKEMAKKWCGKCTTW